MQKEKTYIHYDGHDRDAETALEKETGLYKWQRVQGRPNWIRERKDNVVNWKRERKTGNRSLVIISGR